MCAEVDAVPAAPGLKCVSTRNATAAPAATAALPAAPVKADLRADAAKDLEVPAQKMLAPGAFEPPSSQIAAHIA